LLCGTPANNLYKFAYKNPLMMAILLEGVFYAIYLPFDGTYDSKNHRLACLNLTSKATTIASIII